MKKIFAILLVLCMVFAFGACGSRGEVNDDETTTTTTTSSIPDPEPTSDNSDDTTIDWQSLPDNDIIGAWQSTNSDDPGFTILFTPENTIRIAFGSVVFDADITYGVDGMGNKSAYTEGFCLYGQWTYTVEDDVLTVLYPKYVEDEDEPEFEEQIYKAVEYTPVTIKAKDDFSVNDELVGKWINSTYNDYYEFTEDGYAIYYADYDDGVNVYTSEGKYAYTVSGNELVLYSIDVQGNEVAETFEYSIDGTMLMVGENDYYLNGEGEPVPVTQVVEY